ncbi:DUF2523 family protein [Jeongeupia chitinilytica]|uniref:Membrane protein n=1 Tax=Jeongeupia chitinilytica TaxID=1041641 RepID=A0ABQ3H5K2_9NEIS|nr:DUF2523 family protein [Jeongeupia chitinilytica]GHD66082.1 membrane protein [Jeongeupia chitinilytica]
MPASLFAIFSSVLNVALGFLVRSIIVKFVTFFALFFIVHEFVLVIAAQLPSGGTVSSGLAALPSSVWYFLDLFGFSLGFPAVVSAFALRFIIRRIPVIG